MLVRVAPGQSRFALPGLCAGPRGVVLGADLVLRFATLERVVTFLRLWSAEGRFEDQCTSVRIMFGRAAQGTREVLVRCVGVAAFAVDAAARAARAAQGQGFTGAGRQFVALRDARSPLGYDIDQPSDQAGDLILHAHEGEVVFRVEGELVLADLVLRLELRREPAPPESLSAFALPPLLYLWVRKGLGETMAAYLHRSRVDAEAAVWHDEGAIEPARAYLFKLRDVPARLRRMLVSTPGLSLFVPAAENILVAYGYRHPLPLDAMGGVFAKDRMLFLRPPPQTPRIIEPAPRLVPIDGLIDLPRPRDGAPVVPVTRAEAPDLLVRPRLVPGSVGHERVSATLIPWEQARWLRRLIFALPAPILSDHRVAVLERGLFVTAAEGLGFFPFGELYKAQARGICVPLGYTLRPELSPGLLEERLGTGQGTFVLFQAPDGEPVRIPAGCFEPLERRLFGRLDIPTAPLSTRLSPGADAPEPEIRYSQEGFEQQGLLDGFLPRWRGSG